MSASYKISKHISILNHIYNDLPLYILYNTIHQAPGTSPRQRGPGTSPATQYSIRRVSPGERWEDLFGRQAVRPLVEEEILHHLRHLLGSRPTWPGAGRKQPAGHEEAKETEQEQEEEKGCFNRGEFKNFILISRGTRYVKNHLIFSSFFIAIVYSH